MQRLLLPHQYKRIGVWIAPMGFLLWCVTQMGALNTVLVTNPHGISWRLVGVLSLSFFSFLFGLYFLAFSKEKHEDEYIRGLRLQSFQVAAMIQLLSAIISFVVMVVLSKEPAGDGELELFLVALLLFFWVFYILHFNYTLYRTNKLMNEKHS